MLYKSNLASLCFSDLEKVSTEITRLYQENLSLLFELACVRHQVEEAKRLAEIEATVYSGIKKIFK